MSSISAVCVSTMFLKSISSKLLVKLSSSSIFTFGQYKVNTKCRKWLDRSTLKSSWLLGGSPGSKGRRSQTMLPSLCATHRECWRRLPTAQPGWCQHQPCVSPPAPSRPVRDVVAARSGPSWRDTRSYAAAKCLPPPSRCLPSSPALSPHLRLLPTE